MWGLVRCQDVNGNIDGLDRLTNALLVRRRWLRFTGCVQSEAIGYHHVNLPLSVFLAYALVRGQTRKRRLQRGKIVAAGHTDEEQRPCLCAHIIMTCVTRLLHIRRTHESLSAVVVLRWGFHVSTRFLINPLFAAGRNLPKHSKQQHHNHQKKCHATECTHVDCPRVHW